MHAHLQDCICTLTMSACLNACLSISQSPCPCAWFCVRAGQRMKNEKKKCCQSVMPEQGAEGSRREGAWQAEVMHYSGIIQTERNYWGKTPQGSREHSHVQVWKNQSHQSELLPVTPAPVTVQHHSWSFLLPSSF